MLHHLPTTTTTVVVTMMMIRSVGYTFHKRIMVYFHSDGMSIFIGSMGLMPYQMKNRMVRDGYQLYYGDW
jgi:hypothetical protein